jgi:hypothetical protein
LSTVLWANVLMGSKVKSDETDLLALYKFADKLDAVAKGLRLPSFLDICDTTDQKFNVSDDELPTGMTSTNELMAQQGSWMAMSAAIPFLESLRNHIVAKNLRFGLLSNQQAAVVAELDAVIAFAKAEAASADKFNFSVVM